MLHIMNVAHRGMNKWLIDSGVIKDGDMVLDIGCVGGETLQSLAKINHSGKIYGIGFSQQTVKDSTKANQADVAKGKIIIRQASVSNMPYAEDDMM